MVFHGEMPLTRFIGRHKSFKFEGPICIGDSVFLWVRLVKEIE
jgi:hypothetical protein